MSLLLSCGKTFCKKTDKVDYCINKDSTEIKLSFNPAPFNQIIYYRNKKFYSKFMFEDSIVVYCKSVIIYDKNNLPILCVPHGIVYYRSKVLGKIIYEVNSNKFFERHNGNYFEKNGRYIEYDNKGRVKTFGHYINDSRKGSFLYFDSIGNINKTEKYE